MSSMSAMLSLRSCGTRSAEVQAGAEEQGLSGGQMSSRCWQIGGNVRPAGTVVLEENKTQDRT